MTFKPFLQLLAMVRAMAVLAMLAYVTRGSAVYAQGKFKAGGVEIDRPAGSDILPGANLEGSDFQSSYIFSKLIPFVIRYAIGLAVALSVIAFIVGGYQMMTSFGNAERKTTAIKTLQWAAIGLILSITAFGIVSIISRISFTGGGA